MPFASGAGGVKSSPLMTYRSSPMTTEAAGSAVSHDAIVAGSTEPARTTAATTTALARDLNRSIAEGSAKDGN